MPPKEPLLTVRIDRWLVASRMYKTRGLAQEACEGGLVKVNGRGVKPSALLQRRDEVHIEHPSGPKILRVIDFAEKRLSAPLARLLYDDESPPPPPKEERWTTGLRDRGAGRPTKAERRALERLRGAE